MFSACMVPLLFLELAEVQDLEFRVWSFAKHYLDPERR